MAVRCIQRPFLAFTTILEKFLFEKMCLEFKTALKNVLKIIWETFKKNTQMHLRSFFNAVFNADSESVFSFSLSCLELEKLVLKVFQIIE